ncbi:MAG: ABC transporter permease [Acidimicrobiales bacterium]|jgi:ABC-2 type transport system permease protein|nr:ABC transporter permease [Acidimicrobiales bacterium]
MSGFWTIYSRWFRDRLRSTIFWTVGIALVVVASAAFYPSLSGASGGGLDSGGAAMSSLLGLSQGIDPGSPLGFLWISLYANIYPWMLMALGVALGVAAIAGDEETGALEYLLAKPVTRTTVALARMACAVTILFVVSALSGLSLLVTLPLFDLDEPASTTTAAGASASTTAPDTATAVPTTTAPATTTPATTGATEGVTAVDIFNGTFSSFAVALGLAGIAFALGAATGQKGLALGVASAFGIGGYVLYTLSNMTGSLEPLTWISPWRWYVDDAMLINGLAWDVALPFLGALVGFVAGWLLFLRRDLQNP